MVDHPAAPFVLARLDRAEANARRILRETGFDQHDVHSDEVWTALQTALRRSQSPRSNGARAYRAISALLIAQQLRRHLEQNNPWDAARRAMELGALDDDLLTDAEHQRLLAEQRAAALVRAARSKQETGRDAHEGYARVAAQVRAAHPGASARRVAAMVADACDAKPDTVRRVLRERTRRSRMTDR